MKRKTALMIAAGAGLVAVLVVLALLSSGGHVLATTSRGVPQAADSVAAAALAGGGSGTDGAFLISTVDYDRERPVMAYNSISDTYLIVWADGESGQRDIYGQIYSTQGIPQGDAFPISNATGDQRMPAVAYNLALNQYLVVWEDERVAASTTFVYGQRVGADGSLLDNPGTPEDESDPGINFPVFYVFPAHYILLDPTVASNGVDEYLVAWYAWQDGQIHGQRVGADGSLLDNASTPNDESDPGVDFLITEETVGANNPAVAYSADADEYLVVYLRGAHYPHIYGRRVLANGSPHNPAFPISIADRYKWEPSVAYNPDAHEYLAVWQEDYVAESWRLDNEINGQRVGIDGSLLDNDGTLDVNESDPAISFSVCSAEGFQGYPDLAYVAGASELGQYLVVWQDERHDNSTGIDIYGQRVWGDGTLAEQGDFALSRAAGDQEYPAVAYSSGSHQYLAVWQDDRQGVVSHIYGQRVWWPGLPLGSNFAIGAPPADQEHPAVAYNSEDREYLVVWSDERNGDADIYGQFYDRDGNPLGENFVIDDGVYDQTEPATAYNAIDNDYLVVWRGSTLGNTVIGGRVISSVQGAPLGPAFELSYPLASLGDPAVAHNASLTHNNYLVVFEQLTGTSTDVRAWRVSAEGGLVGEIFTISDAQYWQSEPDVVYNSVEGEFLVVWHDGRLGPHDIYARRVSATGILTGGEIVVADAARDQDNPVIAYNPDDNEYLIVWDDGRVNDVGDIYAQRVLSTGALAGGNITVPVSSPAIAQKYPDVVYVSGLDRYRIVWQEGSDSATFNRDIRGQWLAADGSYVGTLDAPIIRYPGDQEYPAIAYAPGQERALVVWQDGRSGSDTDIYGRFGALDLNPPVARFTRNPGVFRPAGAPFAFNAWPSLDDTTPRGSLEVRWDLDGDGAWDDASFSHDKYVTHTFSAAGLHTVTLQVRDEALLTDTLSLLVYTYEAAPDLPLDGAVASSGPTATLTISPAFKTSGETFTFDGTGSTGGTLLARWDWENDGLFDTGFGAALTATHVYTVAGDYTVRLEVRDSASSLSDAALHNVTVQAGEPISLEVTPVSAAVVAGDLFRFRATAWDGYGNKMYSPAVTWTVAAGDAGAIDSSGIFTASVQAGTYPDAIVVGNGVLTDTASVTVYWPYKVYLPMVLRDD